MGGIRDVGGVGDTRDLEDVRDIGGVGDIGDVGDIRDVGDSRDTVGGGTQGTLRDTGRTPHQHRERLAARGRRRRGCRGAKRGRLGTQKNGENIWENIWELQGMTVMGGGGEDRPRRHRRGDGPRRWPCARCRRRR